MRGGYTGSSREVNYHEHQEDGILLAALQHTFHIFCLFLAFNFVLAALWHCGEDTIASVLAASDSLALAGADRSDLQLRGQCAAYTTFRGGSAEFWRHAGRPLYQVQVWDWQCCAVRIKAGSKMRSL